MLLAPIEPWASCETCRLRCWRLALPGEACCQDSAVPTGWGRAPRVGAGSLCMSAWVSVCVPFPHVAAPQRPLLAPPGGRCGCWRRRSEPVPPPRLTSRPEPAPLPAGSGGRRRRSAPLPGDPLPAAGEVRSCPREGLTPPHLSRPGRAGGGVPSLRRLPCPLPNRVT